MTLSRAAGAYDYWNFIRYSALLPDSTVTVRMENPSGASFENYLLYRQGNVVEEPMTLVPDGPSTLECTVPGPHTKRLFYGFRMIDSGNHRIMPVKVPAGVSPQPHELTRVQEDPAGDELFGFSNLDILDCRISFSDDSLYATIKNAGGGFPRNAGLTFFSYMLGITDPTEAEPDTVWGMIYTYEMAGLISSGLFRIEGTSASDLVKLGEIQVQEFPASDEIRLSCLLSDLKADPLFMAFYDETDPVIGTAAFTQKISILGGASEADQSPGALCYLRDFHIEQAISQLPVLLNAEFQGTGPGASAVIEYFDPDGNCPVVSEIIFNGTHSFNLYPEALDYGSAVVYRSDSGIAPLSDGSWDFAVFRFSDDQESVVEYEIISTADEISSNAAMVTVAPNPFNASTSVTLILPEEADVDVIIYDAAGARIARVLNERLSAGAHDLYWNGKNDSGADLGSGVYFLRVHAGRYTSTRKIVLQR
jgi:hypothetical protein